MLHILTQRSVRAIVECGVNRKRRSSGRDFNIDPGEREPCLVISAGEEKKQDAPAIAPQPREPKCSAAP